MPAKSKTPAPITAEQFGALQKWSAAYGKTWKEALTTAWLRGGDRNPNYSPYLQQIRNQHGPSWLALAKDDLSNVTVKEGE